MINFFMTVFATIVFIAVIVFLNYEYLNLKIGTKTQKIRQLNFDIKEFLTQKNDIQRLLDDLKNESLKVENLVNDLKSSKSDIENQLNQLSSELAKTKTNIQKLLSIKLSEEEKTIQLQESIKISQNLLTTLNLEVSKFKSEKENSEQQFKVAKENLVEIQIALSSAKKQKDNFQLEVSTLNRLIAEKKNSTTHENVDIITFEPELNERIRGEVKHIGYAPNNLFKQENQTNYPYVSMPLPKSVIKFPRKVADGRIGIRGYKEVDFDIYIKRYFSNDGQMTFFNDRFLFISNYTKPYVPDQVLIDEKNDLNLFIDIEIDEPYDGIGRLSTHEKGKDVSRNKYFNDRGWLVIRFAEIQVQNNILGCCKHIAKVVKSVNPNFKIHTDLLQATDIELIPIWNKLESDRWSKENYREEYFHS